MSLDVVEIETGSVVVVVTRYRGTRVTGLLRLLVCYRWDGKLICVSPSDKLIQISAISDVRSDFLCSRLYIIFGIIYVHVDFHIRNTLSAGR